MGISAADARRPSPAATTADSSPTVRIHERRTLVACPEPTMTTTTAAREPEPTTVATVNTTTTSDVTAPHLAAVLLPLFSSLQLMTMTKVTDSAALQKDPLRRLPSLDKEEAEGAVHSAAAAIRRTTLAMATAVVRRKVLPPSRRSAQAPAQPQQRQPSPLGETNRRTGTRLDKVTRARPRPVALAH
jgi:hypothetical protein